MRQNRLRELLRAGKPSLGTRLQSSWPTATEIVGHSQKFDYVEFLAEYAPYDLYALDNVARAIELFPDFTGLIKIESEARAHVAVRAIAAGIQNVLFTDVRSAEDAQACVRAVRPETPEDGGLHGNAAGRSVGAAGGGGAPAIIQSYRDAVIMLMIEKKGAIENLEAILAVPGIDMVQFGPSDYSWSIGVAGQREHPAVIEARTHMIKTALKMGVQPRAEIMSAREAEPYLELGVRHFNIGTDAGVLFRWYNDQGGAMRELLAKA